MKNKREQNKNRRNQRQSKKATSTSDSVTTPASTPSTSDTTSTEPGTLLRQFLSANAAHTQNGKETRLAPGTEIKLGNQTFKACNATVYHVSKHAKTQTLGALIDGGCNGDLAGNDVRILEESFHKVDVMGIADSKLESIPLGTVAGLVSTTKGPIIAIFHQYALYGKGITIVSTNQSRTFGLDINETPNLVQEVYSVSLPLKGMLSHCHT